MVVNITSSVAQTPSPDAPPAADSVLVESTCGDPSRPGAALLAERGPLLQRVAARGDVAPWSFCRHAAWPRVAVYCITLRTTHRTTAT